MYFKAHVLLDIYVLSISIMFSFFSIVFLFWCFYCVTVTPVLFPCVCVYVSHACAPSIFFAWRFLCLEFYLNQVYARLTVSFILHSASPIQLKWQWSIIHSCVFLPAECNCHKHSSECYYEPKVEQRGASLNMQGEYQGGGVCMKCQVGKHTDVYLLTSEAVLMWCNVLIQ